MRSLPPRCQPGASALTGHTRGTASEKLEEGGGHGRSVCRDLGGATRVLQWLGQCVTTPKGEVNRETQS